MTAVLAEIFARQCTDHAGSVAIGSAKEQLTYRELAERTADVAQVLWNAGGTAARVAIYSGNSPDYVTAHLAVLRAGAVPFLMDPAWGHAEMSAMITRCGLTAVAHDRPLPSGIRVVRTTPLTGSIDFTLLPSHDAAPDLLGDTEVCRFTSGSTGRPNCIEFSGSAVANAARAWVAGTSMEQTDRVLCFAGLYNGLAFNTSLLPVFLAGASLWLPSGLPTSGQVARFLREIEPTRLTGFPALYDSLLRRDGPVPGLAELRVALSSAAPLPVSTLIALRERFGLAVCNYYGIAETGPLTFDPDPRADAGLGYPLPGVEFAAPEAGRQDLRVRSSSQGSRYLNVPGGLAAKIDDGYYRTGDVGEFRDGRLFLLGRAETINIGGRKVDAAEIRTVLLGCTGVEDAVVYAEDKANGDPAIVAAVGGPAAPPPAELRSRCASSLAAYKVPERVHVFDALPRTPLGKLRMTELRGLITARRSEPVPEHRKVD
ncbi:acyl--CoA ligase [Saccharothrix sp. AJ9571]|nr:acyl--CoA ligase [Saccharothrix sp. AJ9571]